MAEPYVLTMGEIDALEERYTPVPVPPCRVCGGELTAQSMGGGRPTEYACPKPPGVSYGEWSEHYRASGWTQPREGDYLVRALIAEVRARRLGHGYPEPPQWGVRVKGTPGVLTAISLMDATLKALDASQWARVGEREVLTRAHDGEPWRVYEEDQS